MNIFLKNIKEGMYYFAELIANLINTTLLLFAFIFVVGPTAIIAKIVGKKFLQAKGGWADMSDNKKKREDFYKQF